MAFNPQHHSSWDAFTSTDTDWVLDSNFGTIPSDNTSPRFPGGRYINFDNTGFGFKSIYRAIGGASGFWFHFAYRQYTDPGGGFGSSRAIFSIEKPSTSTILLTVNTRPSDGKLDITAGATTLTTTAVFDFGNVGTPGSGKWRSIEVLYDVSGDVKVYVDDVLDVDLNITTSNDQPERIKFYWSNIGNMGYNVDDFVYSQSNAGAASERQGPVRISSWLLGKDEVTGFGRVGAGSNANAVHDRIGLTSPAPDGDATFVQATIPAKDLYTLARASNCTGRILAMGATLVAKSLSGTPSMRPICRANPTNALLTGLGSPQPLTGAYTVFQGYSIQSPLTNDYWVDGEVENALWGIESTGSGITRATMLSIEKIQSLRSVPFKCGKLGSYSWSY